MDTTVWKIISLLCIFSAIDASLNTICNVNADCAEIIETCNSRTCECSGGHNNVNGECKSSSITVILSTQSISVVYGSDVVLTASITSEVPLNLSSTIKWLKGQTGGSLTEFYLTPSKYMQNDEGPGQVTLTIQSVNFGDARAYRLVASNIVGTTSTSNQVSITVTGEKPNVDVPGTISETDTTLTIHCTASVTQGSPALTYIHWLFNGANLSSTDNTKYSGGNLNTPSLTINKIASIDIGEYRCVATNLVGSTTSSQSVTLAPPSGVTISQQPVGIINYASSVTLTGSYTSKLLNVTIKWQKLTGRDFIDIDITTDKYIGSSVTGPSPKLFINTVQFIDETSYGLVVSNGIGFSKSNFISLNVIGGALIVSTDASITGRVGGSITLGCTVTGPEVKKIQWMKYVNNAPVNILIDGLKFSGGSVSTKALTIHSLTNDDARQYQCTASNPGGYYSSVDKATVTVKYGQFNEDCTNSEPCDSSRILKCSNNKCLCFSIYYHKDQVCYSKTRLAPTTIFLNSTTTGFSVFWNNPTAHVHYGLVSSNEVVWRVSGSSVSSSGQLDRAVNQYTVSSYLKPGQLYIVNVMSLITLTEPADSMVVTSDDRTVRLVPLPPGPILKSSYFAHDNLIIKWTAPANRTFVTKYRVSIDGATQQTLGGEPEIQFSAKALTPGMNCTVKIVTISGATDVKESLEYFETIRIISTKPDPPTDVRCPESPLDVSLEITWTAPTNQNGRIVQYWINIKEQSRTIFTFSDSTTENIEGLLPEQAYTFTVQTINDAAESIRVSDPSSAVTCQTIYGVSSPPTNLVLYAIQSRGFQIGFYVPDKVFGILAGYKIILTKEKECVQQIQVFASSCYICMSTSGCPAPISHNTSDIYLPVSYTVTGLKPYTQYIVTVTAINGVGEGHRRQISILTDEEVPQKPRVITSSDVQANQLNLSWNVSGPSPGNTTYTIGVYEASDDKGAEFTLIKDVKVFGFDSKTVSVTGLEEYWPYRFKVNAATVKGNITSDFSSIFTTEQAPPGHVVGLTVYQSEDNFHTAYVRWSLPALKDHNSILANFEYETNNSGEIKREYIPVSLFQQTVQRRFSVVPSTVYFVQVFLINIANMTSPPSRIIYRATVRATKESNTALVVGIVVGVLVLLFIIWTIFFMWKRKQSLKKNQTSTYTDIIFHDFSNNRDQAYSSMEYKSNTVHLR